MIEKEGKYHIKINCSSQLVEINMPGKPGMYRLGDKIILRGNIRIVEILKCNSSKNLDSSI